jgi:hypothetical protein
MFDIVDKADVDQSSKYTTWQVRTVNWEPTRGKTNQNERFQRRCLGFSSQHKGGKNSNGKKVETIILFTWRSGVEFLFFTGF